MGYLAIFSLTLLAASSTLALQFNEVDELYACDMYPIAKNLTVDWMTSVPVWYVPFWNNLEYYQNADDFFGPEGFANLTKSDLDNSCIYYKENKTLVPVYGFGGKKIEYEVFPDPLRFGIEYWALKRENGDKDYVCTAYVTKTDGKTYFVTVNTWGKRNEVTKGFFVSSSVPQFDEETLKDIKEHVTSLGFNPSQFFEYSYEKCPPPPAKLALLG